MAQSYATLNDIEPSWADLSVTISPYDQSLLDITEIAAIKWARSVEVGTRKGTSGGRIMARTTGESSFEASATFYRTGHEKLIAGLAANAPTRGNQKRISLVAFDILIQHTPPGSSQIFTTKIKGCRLLGDSSDMAEGTDAQQIELTLNPIEIVSIVDGEEILLL